MGLAAAGQLTLNGSWKLLLRSGHLLTQAAKSADRLVAETFAAKLYSPANVDPGCVALKFLSRLRAKIRYLVDRAFAREAAGQLLLFGVLVSLVSMFGITAMFFGLFHPNNAEVEGIPRELDEGILDAAWWTLTYIVRLPAFENMYGATGPVLFYALALSIMGLGVFGVLVSVINNAMRRRIELLQQGDTPVIEQGHILILGWNKRIVVVLRQLARLQPGARVVILADMDIVPMSEALRVAGITREKLTVILRNGVPGNSEELDRMAIDRASAVIILSNGADDSDAIKTLVLLSRWERWHGQPPSLTAEISLEKNYELAEIAARKRIHVVSASRVSSKIIVQTIRNHGLAGVYDELMSLDGNSIYVQPVAACADLTIREIAYGFTDALPIGVTWEAQEGGETQHKAGLNPEPDYDLMEDEQLVFVANSPRIDFKSDIEPHESAIYRQRESRVPPPQQILLLGWSDILYDILFELNAHATVGSAVTVVADLSELQLEEKLDEPLRASLTNLDLGIRLGDATERVIYEDLDIDSFGSVVVLADETTDEDADTRALRVLLRLSERDDYVSFQDKLIVELLDGTNRDLVDGLGVRDIVVTSDLISAQLAQVSQQKVLGSIYRELLSAGGVEFSLRPVTEYVSLRETCRFDDLTYAAQQHSEIAIGLYLSHREVLLNPPRQQQWSLSEDDQLIVLAQQIYR